MTQRFAKIVSTMALTSTQRNKQMDPEEARKEESIRNAWDQWFDKEYIAEVSVDFTPYQFAFMGRCIFVNLRGDYPYISGVYTNPVWGSVFREFDKSLRYNGISDHIFLEGFRPLPKNEWPNGIRVPAGVDVLAFAYGS